MKTKDVKLKAMAIVFLLMTIPLTSKAQDKVEASVGADLVSGYVWRGQELGGVSIQPSASVTYKGFSLCAWGSIGFESTDTKEFDLTLSYSSKGFSVSVTDYWFNKTKDGTTAKYFRYGAHDAIGSHLFEAQIGYDFGLLAVNWYTNFAGVDGLNKDGDRAYSSYISMNAPFTLGGLDWNAEVGATPWATDFYGANGFAVCNVSLGVSKNIKINEIFALPLFAKMTWNPRSEGTYFVVGIKF